MANKKRKLGNRADDYMEEKVETFGNRDYPDDILDLLDNEGVTVSTDEVSIMSTHADPTQPRNITPREIDEERDGDPAKMPEKLQAWAEHLYDTGNDLPIVKILKGQAEPSQFKTGQGIVDKFVDLLELAFKIRNVGLLQRIGIRAHAGQYTIIYGERRWTAFHILNHFLPAEDWSTIPAKVADVSEWVIAKMQAQENVREEPNAIGKARMFAKLLMASYADNSEYKFDPPHAINAPTCDRPWFAQAKNLRIPRGMGAEFETALGISTAQMRQYSKLLAITEEYDLDNMLWNFADEHDWAEGFMREISKELEIDTVREIIYTVTAVTVSQIEDLLRTAIESAKNAQALAKKQAQSDTSSPSPQGSEATDRVDSALGRVSAQSLYPIGTTVYVGADAYEVVGMNATGEMIKTISQDTGRQHSFNIKQLSPTPPAEDNQDAGEPVGTMPALSTNTSDGQNDGQASDNPNSPTPAELDFFQKSALTWVGKPGQYEGQPIFVLQVDPNNSRHLIIQSGKNRKSVHVATIHPPKGITNKTTVQDFMSGDTEDDTGDAEPPRNEGEGAGGEGQRVDSPHVLQGTDRTFIVSTYNLAQSERLKTTALKQLYSLRTNQVDEDTAQLLIDAYAEITQVANHLKDKSAMLFTDLNDYIGDNHGE